MRVLNTQQMREADRQTIDDVGIPVDRADGERRPPGGRGDGGGVRRLASSKVGVLCGRGNNGGDGFVVARTLAQRGIEAMSFLLGSVAEVRGDARTNLEVLGRIGLTVVEITNAQEWELHFSEISECDLHRRCHRRHRVPRPADAGCSRRSSPTSTASACRWWRSICRPGVSADSHEVEGEAIEASMTVTLAAPKMPLDPASRRRLRRRSR